MTKVHIRDFLVFEIYNFLIGKLFVERHTQKKWDMLNSSLLFTININFVGSSLIIFLITNVSNFRILCFNKRKHIKGRFSNLLERIFKGDKGKDV